MNTNREQQSAKKYLVSWYCDMKPTVDFTVRGTDKSRQFSVKSEVWIEYVEARERFESFHIDLFNSLNKRSKDAINKQFARAETLRQYYEGEAPPCRCSVASHDAPGRAE